jgi:flagellar basal-body rod protein FlgF
MFGSGSMENAVLIGLSRQIALGRELDVIANNVANVSTNGFKARSARFREYLQSGGSASSARPAERRLSYTIDAGTPLDPSAGAIERTGSPLDLAIRGDGFFAVETARGERYTRNGAFQVDAKGTLVTSDGNAVLGERGPIGIGPQETNLAIAPDGTVSTSQGQRGKVRLVRFETAQALVSEGGNLLASSAAAQPAGPTSRLEPGALERSNVKPVIEMSRLVEVSRAYAESAAMVSRLDDLRRNAIGRLADTAAN